MGLFDSLVKKKPQPAESAPVAAGEPIATAELEPAPLPDLSELFPYPVVACRGGEQVEIDLYRMRKELQGSGTYPIIVGDRDSAMSLLDGWDQPFDYDGQMALSRRTIVEDWFRAQLDKHPLPEQGAAPAVETIESMIRLRIGFDNHGEPRKEVFIATIPTPHSSSVPIYLHFGDWNACPSAWVHAMLARYWREMYGAELASITADTIEFTVADPPATDEAALTLATQQYLYCRDIVDKGVGSVEALAELLRGSTRWFFWWD